MEDKPKFVVQGVGDITQDAHAQVFVKAFHMLVAQATILDLLNDDVVPAKGGYEATAEAHLNGAADALKAAHGRFNGGRHEKSVLLAASAVSTLEYHLAHAKKILADRQARITPELQKAIDESLAVDPPKTMDEIEAAAANDPKVQAARAARQEAEAARERGDYEAAAEISGKAATVITADIHACLVDAVTKILATSFKPKSVDRDATLADVKAIRDAIHAAALGVSKAMLKDRGGSGDHIEVMTTLGIGVCEYAITELRRAFKERRAMWTRGDLKEIKKQ